MAKTGIGAPLVHFSSVGESTWLNDLPVHANPNYVVYLNDFHTATDFNSSLEWNVVKDASASAAIVGDGLGGEVVLTSATTTDNDGAYAGLVQETFYLRSGKKVWFSARVKVGATPADMDMWTGLSEAVATNPENVIADATHRVGFELVEGSASLLFKTSNGTTASSVDTGVTLTSGTYVKVDFIWDGVRTVKYYVNNIYKGSKTTHLPATTDKLCPGMYILSGNATDAFTGTWDYIEVVMER